MQETKDNECTCNAEKSVRFNLPTKTRTSTTTTRHENQKVIEGTTRKVNGRYERKGNGNMCRGNSKGSLTNTCCAGKFFSACESFKFFCLILTFSKTAKCKN